MKQTGETGSAAAQQSLAEGGFLFFLQQNDREDDESYTGQLAGKHGFA